MAQRLQALLVAHAEALLLVDHHQPQAGEGHIVLQQAVGADQDVDLAGRQRRQQRALLAAAVEARQRLDAHRPVGEAVAEGLAVLLGQQRGRRQHRGLQAVEGGDEGGAHADLGLAEAHVAAHDPVHRRVRRQVRQHLLDGLRLVRRRIEREAVGEARVVRRPGQRAAAPRPAARLHLQQFGGRVAGALGGAAAHLLPLVAAQRVQRRVLRVRAAVAGDAVQLRDRHVQAVAGGVLQEQELVLLAVDLELAQAPVTADAVVLVHHRAAEPQLAQFGQQRFRVAPPPRPRLLRRAVREQPRLGHHRDSGRGQLEAVVEVGDRQRQRRIVAQEVVPAGGLGGPQLQSREALAQLLAPPGRLRGEQHPARRRRGEEAAQRTRRLLILRSHLQFRQRPHRVVVDIRAGARLALEAVRAPLRMPRQPGCQLRRIQIQIRHRQRRALGIVQVDFAARCDRLQRRGRGGGRIAPAGKQGIGRQVVEQAGGALEEQRQVVLDAGRRQRVADAAVDRAVRGVGVEGVAEVAAEAVDGRRRQREFPPGQRRDRLDRAGRGLPLGIELAQGVERAVEEVQPAGPFRAHREQVHQRAPHRELAGFADLGTGAVAEGVQPGAQGVDLELVAAREAQRAVTHVFRGTQPLQQRGRGGEQQAAAAVAELGQRAQALRDDLAVRRGGVVGQGLPVGEGQRRLRAVEEEAAFALQRELCGDVGRDRHHQPLLAARQFGQRQRPGGAVQLAAAQRGAGRGGDGRGEHGAAGKKSGGRLRPPRGLGRRPGRRRGGAQANMSATMLLYQL